MSIGHQAIHLFRNAQVNALLTQAIIVLLSGSICTKKRHLKQFFLTITLLFSCLAFGQNFSDEWTGYFAYGQVNDVSEGNGALYVASENAVFVYSTLDGSLTTKSTINGLSGNDISSIYYSAEFETLLVGYENGIIDVIVGDNQNVLTVVDILNKQSIPPTKKELIILWSTMVLSTSRQDLASPYLT